MSLATAYPTKPAGSLPDSALGDVGTRLRRLRETALPSGALSGPRHARALDSLYAACRSASSENWDGYGARPVGASAFEHAKVFLQLLPTDASFPDVSVDPDGEIALEWYLAPRAVFSVSIGEEGLISYAGLFGWNKVNGVEVFAGAIPVAVLQSLRRLLSSARS